ncbi:alpha/beta fold hydrolase [uncultured Caballeronia sp.]|uniref:alpha/beta fold hydrolase n=1 Tax=uncultured Caballeronia sp. TaxID=1827198 RepID=UPI0015766CFE
MDWIAYAHEGNYGLPDFLFADGKRLNIRLKYRTLGHRSNDNDNAVLMLHGTTGSGAQFLEPEIADHLFGTGQPLDINKYFIVMPDSIGHGGSSKPSDGLEQAFPQYGYANMVDAQCHLVRQGLGFTHLRLILGTSMGGMQTWLWGQRYPEMMDALVPIASLPAPISGRNLLMRRLLIQSIRSDPAYLSGGGKGQVPSLGLAWNIFNLFLDSSARLAEQFTNVAHTDAYIKQVAHEALQSQNANDVIWEFNASADYDPAGNLDRIIAPLLAINFADDDINVAALGVLDRAIQTVHSGRAITLKAGPDSKGHQTLKVAATWQRYLEEFMTQTRRPPPTAD